MLVLAGCGGHAAAIHRAPPPSPSKRCKTPVHATPLWFRASDGLVLDGALLGSGEVGVVALHGFPGSICDTLPFAAVLARAGFRVLVYDTRGFGLSQVPYGMKQSSAFAADLHGASDVLRAHGAKKVFLVGFSFGGTIVGASGARVQPRVAGIVDVSGPASLQEFFPGSHDLDGPLRAKDLDVPILYLAAQHDARIVWDGTREMIRRAPVRDKQLYIYPGDYHAFALLDNAPYRARVWRTVLRFLRTR